MRSPTCLYSQFAPQEAYHIIFLVTQPLFPAELTSVPIAVDDDGRLRSYVRVNLDLQSLKATLTLV
jgi:hypothetical protein